MLSDWRVQIVVDKGPNDPKAVSAASYQGTYNVPGGKGVVTIRGIVDGPFAGADEDARHQDAAAKAKLDAAARLDAAKAAL